MKMYRFSGTKHAHDIELRNNRLFIEMHNMEVGNTEFDEEAYDKMDSLKEKLQELLGYMHEGVCMIPGKLYGIAMDTVMWADAYRNRH